MRNNKGFAISGIMYAILIISLILVVGTLKTLQNRKTIIDKVKSETVDALDINNYQELLSKVEQLENGFLDKTYPVGTIYISIENAKTPSELFGGTWEQIGQGRTLIGAGANGGYTFTAGSTGTTVGATTNPLGEYTHTLTVPEMPRHSHMLPLQNQNNAFALGSNKNGVINYSNTLNSDYAGGDINGNTVSHNNIQPYIVTYMWKRTS